MCAVNRNKFYRRICAKRKIEIRRTRKQIGEKTCTGDELVFPCLHQKMYKDIHKILLTYYKHDRAIDKYDNMSQNFNGIYSIAFEFWLNIRP